MKLLIAGSRKIEDFDISKYVTNEIDVILSGGAKGVDTIAEEFADKNKLSKMIMIKGRNEINRFCLLKCSLLQLKYY